MLVFLYSNILFYLGDIRIENIRICRWGGFFFFWMRLSTLRIFYIYVTSRVRFFAIFLLGIECFGWVRFPKSQTYVEANLYPAFTPRTPASFPSYRVPSF